MQVALTPSERMVLEQPWELTQATPGQRTGIVALGAFNLVGVLVLGGMLGDAALKAQLARSSLGVVVSAFPALQVRCGVGGTSNSCLATGMRLDMLCSSFASGKSALAAALAFCTTAQMQ